jgi:hypothetical protein
MPHVTRHNARAIRSLAESTATLAEAVPRAAIEAACARGYFRPLEEEALLTWFARLLSLRDALWTVIAEVVEAGGGRRRVLLQRLDDGEQRRLFLVGYAAACLLVRLDRLLVEEVAAHRLTQRKLNEGSLRLRIPRKQYTAVFESMALPRNAILMKSAMAVADKERAALRALARDPEIAPIADRLPWLEEALDPSKARYASLLLAYRDHALRRRGASANQQAAFGLLESSGRLVAELRDHWGAKRVTDEVRDALRVLLEPGDVLVTRHDVAMSNLFFPGAWPHAALYVGSPRDRRRLGITVDAEVARHWRDDRNVLEALKDGVRFRPLAETLAVDAVALLRPRLDASEIARAIERVAPHQGKMYNFDFDFFRSDRLVCTEVVYRAYDDVMAIPLNERAGRPTLSAEDLVRITLAGDRFDAVAVFGAAGCEDRLVVGDAAHEALAASLDADPSSDS